MNDFPDTINVKKKLGYFRSQNDRLRTENERLNAIILNYENREASVCPENTPFEEVIKRLKGEVETLKRCLFQMQNAAKDPKLVPQSPTSTKPWVKPKPHDSTRS